MAGNHVHSRDHLAMKDEKWDVLVIGGGIVGAGAARDSAMRGLKTLLVEKNDFAFGTSSRSTRLLHGGIRYLAQGRLGLVSQASREKLVIRRIAPHLALPLKFVFPTWKGEGWALWQLRIGVKIYDFLASRRNFAKSGYLDRSELLDMFPGLKEKDLKGGVFYYDGFTSDSRLVIDTLKSAKSHGALLLRSCRFVSAEPRNGGWEARLEDHIQNKEFTCFARAIVNASGPWADLVPGSGLRLRKTKGIHLVVDRERLPGDAAIVFTKGDRILFAIPFGKRAILGTTDTDYQGPLDRVKARKEEAEYILGAINDHFPGACMGLEHIKATWAGIRPLLGGKAGSPSDITRKHKIASPAPGWFDIGGGKLTTYRLMAVELVDTIFRYFKKHPPRCGTAEEPLVSTEEARMGALDSRPPSEELVRHFCEKEWALDIEDIMARRTSWQFILDDPIKAAERISEWMEKILGWSREERQKQIMAYKASWIHPFE